MATIESRKTFIKARKWGNTEQMYDMEWDKNSGCWPANKFRPKKKYRKARCVIKGKQAEDSSRACGGTKGRTLLVLSWFVCASFQMAWNASSANHRWRQCVASELMRDDGKQKIGWVKATKIKLNGNFIQKKEREKESTRWENRKRHRRTENGRKRHKIIVWMRVLWYTICTQATCVHEHILHSLQNTFLFTAIAGKR